MRRLVMVVLGSLVGLTGCGPMAEQAQVPPPPASPTMARTESDAVGGAAPGAPTGGSVKALPQTSQLSRKLVYEATISVQVADLARAVEKLRTTAQQMGGYVSNLSQGEHGGASSAHVTMRVPVEQYESALAAVAALGRVQSQRQQAKDVTDEWVDLDARQRNLQREEERLLDLLQRAGKVADLLTVEKELARVREQIEQVTGKLRLLNSQVALSTIEVELSEPQPTSVVPRTGWSVLNACRGAFRTFITLGQTVVTWAIYLVVLLPYLLLLMAVLWALRRLRRWWRG